MLYRDIPSTGKKLSILGFGCMRLPQKNGVIDQLRAIAQIRSAIDSGVNYIDTAMPYHDGQSEPLVARALRDGYRERVSIATKLSPWLVSRTEDMNALLERQAKNLEVDKIDFYLLHALQQSTWLRLCELGALEFLDQAKEDGRIGHAGFSFHGRPEDFNAIVDAYDWDFCMIQYNFLDESNQAGRAGLEYAAEKGLGVIVMEPLRGGVLASNVPPAVQELWDQAPVQRKPVEWALRWIWDHPQVTVVLSGMNEEAHIEDNLRVASEAQPDSLSGEERALVEQAVDIYRERMPAGCTGCGYCMPCPFGVNIPACLQLHDQAELSGNFSSARRFYILRVAGALGDEPGWAAKCTKCGACLKACPQNIPIPDVLPDVVARFEGIGTRVMAALSPIYMRVLRWFSLRGWKTP